MPHTVYSYPSRKERRESDEEIILERGIVKTTDFRVEFEEGSPPATGHGVGVAVGEGDVEGIGKEREVPHAM